MSRTSSDAAAGSGRILIERRASGPTMGASFEAQYFAPPQIDPAPLAAALQASVDRVDGRMSTWKPDSDLSRLNRSPVGVWTPVPEDLLFVLDTALRIGRKTRGAFDIAVGEAVCAWGFGPPDRTPDAGRIREVLSRHHGSARENLELDLGGGRARRLGSASFDLSGIAKGFGVDELARCLECAGVGDYLVSIDGELRCKGRKPSGAPWTVAVETPGGTEENPLGVLELRDCAIATSGDYRNYMIVNGRPVSHVIDPQRGRPAAGGVTMATVIAPDCTTADAWATSLLLLPPDEGLRMVRQEGMEALLLLADGRRLASDIFGYHAEERPAGV